MFTFREITIDDAKLLLDWRTQKRVAQFMTTEVIYDLETQRKWLEGSFSKPNYYHWIVQSSGKDIGFVSFIDPDGTREKISWGIYVGEENALGIGGMVPPYFYNFCFNKLGVKKISAEVFYTNPNAVKLHLMHGYHFTPEFDRVIDKDGENILLINMELEKEVFLNSRFKKYKTHFEVRHWKHANTLSDHR